MSQLLLVLFSLVMPFTSSNEVGDPYTVGDKVERLQPQECRWKYVFSFIC